MTRPRFTNIESGRALAYLFEMYPVHSERRMTPEQRRAHRREAMQLRASERRNGVMNATPLADVWSNDFVWNLLVEDRDGNQRPFELSESQQQILAMIRKVNK